MKDSKDNDHEGDQAVKVAMLKWGISRADIERTHKVDWSIFYWTKTAFIWVTLPIINEVVIE